MRQWLTLAVRLSLAIALFASAFAATSAYARSIDAGARSATVALVSMQTASDDEAKHPETSHSKDHHPKGASHCLVQCVSALDSRPNAPLMSLAYEYTAYYTSLRAIIGVKPVTDDRPPRL